MSPLLCPRSAFRVSSGTPAARRRLPYVWRLCRYRHKRHTFAVHTLLRWYREGADLQARLPVLATYLGHASIEGTQDYLQMTAELYPEIAARSHAAFSDVIPRRRST